MTQSGLSISAVAKQGAAFLGAESANLARRVLNWIALSPASPRRVSPSSSTPISEFEHWEKWRVSRAQLLRELMAQFSLLGRHL